MLLLLDASNLLAFAAPAMPFVALLPVLLAFGDAAVLVFIIVAVVAGGDTCWCWIFAITNLAPAL